MNRKSTNTKKSQPEAIELPIKALRSATCKTLSETATLTYEVGLDDQERVFLRIADSSGAGNWSREWIMFTDIQAAIEDWPDDKPINALTLRPLFYGASVNTPGFLIGALLAEKLLEPQPGKKRCQQACDPGPFLASLEKLKQKSPSTPRKKPTGKAKAKRPAPRKKSPASRKTTK